MRQLRVLHNDRQIKFLFYICWLAYFSTYVGRINYSAVMAEIIWSEGFTNGESGLVGTGFFIAYGAGQLFSGILGDKVSPKYMVFFGVLISSFINFGMGLTTTAQQMLFLWCANGLAQSMTWSPILRIFSEYLPSDRRKKACVNISTTYVAAVLGTYLISSLIVSRFSWRPIFFVSFGFMLVVSVVWFWGMGRAERFERAEDETEGKQLQNCVQKMNFHRGIVLLLIFVGTALAMQGILRDGIITWVPTYVTDVFHTDTSFSILVTTLLPIINLAGVYAADLIRTKCGRNEIQTAAILFGISILSISAILLFGSHNILITLLAFGLTTSCMLGINTMLVSMLPTYFVRFGRVSFVSGLLNSCVYIGSSAATYGIGVVADGWGWSVLVFCLCLIAAVGVLLCVTALPLWKGFVAENSSKWRGKQ